MTKWIKRTGVLLMILFIVYSFWFFNDRERIQIINDEEIINNVLGNETIKMMPEIHKYHPVLLAYEFVPSQYNLVLNEYDEYLIVTITLDHSSDAYIILEGLFKNVVYKIPTNNGSKATYYINKGDLKGAYDIYLSIGDKTYTTKRYIKFN
jgi:hypothetical protein